MQPISNQLSHQAFHEAYAVEPRLQHFVEIELRAERFAATRHADAVREPGVHISGMDQLGCVAANFQPRSADQILAAARCGLQIQVSWEASVEGRLSSKLGMIYQLLLAAGQTYDMAQASQSRGLTIPENLNALGARLEEIAAAARQVLTCCATGADDVSAIRARLPAAA